MKAHVLPKQAGSVERSRDSRSLSASVLCWSLGIARESKMDQTLEIEQKIELAFSFVSMSAFLEGLAY